MMLIGVDYHPLQWVAGLLRYIASFKQSRRDPSFPKRSQSPRSIVDTSRVTALRSQGIGWKKIAALLGVGVGTLYRLFLDGSKIQGKVI